MMGTLFDDLVHSLLYTPLNYIISSLPPYFPDLVNFVQAKKDHAFCIPPNFCHVILVNEASLTNPAPTTEGTLEISALSSIVAGCHTKGHKIYQQPATGASF